MFGNSGYSQSLFSQSLAGFFAESKSAVLDYKLRAELVSKCRVLYSKIPLARAIISTLVRGVVGSGLRLNVQDELWDTLSSTYSFDAMRQQDLYQLQQQVFETMLLCGECWLIRQKNVNEAYSGWFLAESDHVFNPPFLSIAADGNFYYKNHLIIDGIEFASNGRPLAIHYCKSPYTTDVSNKKLWTRIRFYDQDGLPNVIQLKLADRVEYPRGIPLLAPLIETLYSLYAFNQAQIQLGILQSCQCLVVKTTTNKTLNPFVGLSPSDLNAPLVQEKPTDDTPKQEFSIVPPNNRDVFGMLNNANYVTPGTTIHLNPDESLDCVAPQGPQDSLRNYYDLVLEQCASAIGVPKACLSTVYDTSFSSSKASLAQYNYTISKYRKAFIEQCLKVMYRVYLIEMRELSLTDAYKESIKSEWLSIDPPLVVDEVRTFQLYKDAFALGIVTRDEIAQTLFAHKAHEDERLNEFITKGKV